MVGIKNPFLHENAKKSAICWTVVLLTEMILPQTKVKSKSFPPGNHSWGSLDGDNELFGNRV